MAVMTSTLIARLFFNAIMQEADHRCASVLQTYISDLGGTHFAQNL